MKKPTICCLFFLLLSTFLTATPAFALQQNNEQTKVVLQLKWSHLFQFAGYYAAVEKGYYQDAGLKVIIHEATPQSQPVDAVLQGNADFGISTSELVVHRAKGKPVVALAAIFQHSPMAIMALRDGPIQTIHDLAGKKVMIEQESAELYAYLGKEGLAKEKVAIVPHTFDVQDLLQGRVDAMSVYITDEPYLARKAGRDPILFTAQTVGIDFYGDCLFTSEGLIKTHPEIVRAFREASLKGWNYALDHPEELIQVIHQKYLPEADPDQLRYEALKISQIVRKDIMDIGYMSEGRWKHIADTYADVGLMPRNVSLKGFIYDPNPENISRELTLGLIWTGFALLLAVLIAIRFVRLSRRLKQSEEKLRTTEENLRQKLHLSPSALVMIRLSDHAILFVNRQLEKIFRFDEMNSLGQTFDFWASNTERDKILTQLQRDGIVQENEVHFRRSDGEEFCALLSSVAFEFQDEKVYLFSILDIQDRKVLENALRASEERFRQMVEIAPFPLVLTRMADNRLLYVNMAASRMFDAPQETLIGALAPEYYVNPQDREPIITDIKAGREVKNREVLLRGSANTPITVLMSANVTNYRGEAVLLTTLYDITERKRLEEELATLATTDALTGIANRRLFVSHAEEEIAKAARYHRPLSLLFIDIDHFKRVNDTYTHLAGDAALRHLTGIITPITRSTDLFARIGGEEFALLLPETPPEVAVPLAERIRAAVEAAPLHWKEKQISMTISIGIASLESAQETIDTLIAKADKGLYTAKSAGRNQVHLVIS